MLEKYDIVLADPPWPYEKLLSHTNQADSHYSLMTAEDIYDYSGPEGEVLFLWATGPKLHLAMKTIEAWGYNYRGVAFTWVKVAKDGHVINGKGVRPTVTKPLSEYCLVGTRVKKGRPLPLLDEGVPSVILAQATKHSKKPEVIYEMIDRLYGDTVTKIELFSRSRREGWDVDESYEFGVEDGKK